MEKDLQTISDIYKELRAIVKNADESEDIADIVKKLYNHVNGKVYIKASKNGISIDGDVNGYTISYFILNSSRESGLNMVIEDLTMAYWRTVLKKQEYSTPGLIEAIS